MKHSSCITDEFFRVNAAKPALPRCWCCPLQAEAAKGCFGGDK